LKKNVILSTSQKNGVFSHSYECEEYENMSIVTVKNRYASLRKFARHVKDENVILPKSQLTKKIFKDRLKRYNGFSLYTVLPVMDKICRKAAIKFGAKIPLEEIFIIGDADEAFAIISRIYKLSRLFTVILPSRCEMTRFDDLYFEHGVLVRQLSSFGDKLLPDSMVIKCNSAQISCPENIPVIDMCGFGKIHDRVLNVQSISISDAKLSRIQKVWGGVGGAQLYELLGELPDDNAQVDVNVSADEIFLLDREKI